MLCIYSSAFNISISKISEESQFKFHFLATFIKRFFLSVPIQETPSLKCKVKKINEIRK